MFYKFIYKSVSTGKLVYSQVEQDDEDLKLVQEYKDKAIKSKEVKTK